MTSQKCKIFDCYIRSHGLILGIILYVYISDESHKYSFVIPKLFPHKLDFESYITNVILFRYDFNNNRYFSFADYQLKIFLLWSNRWTIWFNFFYKNIKLIIILHPKEKLKSFFSEFIFFDVISACVCSLRHYFLLIEKTSLLINYSFFRSYHQFARKQLRE